MSEDNQPMPGLRLQPEDFFYRPTGIIQVYIPNGDGVPDGINVVGGLPDLEGLQGITGEGAQRYEGRIDLDPASETFGLLDPKYGFQNTRFPHNLFNNAGTSIGTYQPGVQNDGGKDQQAYEFIKNHPNFSHAVHFQLVQLDLYATKEKKDKNELIKKLKANNPEVGALFEKIVNKDIDHTQLGLPNSDVLGQYTPEHVKGLPEDLQKEFFSEVLDDNDTIEKIEVSDGRDDDTPYNLNFEPLLNTFDNAPEQFKESFGVFGGGILSLKYPHDAVYGGGGVAGQDHIVIEQFQYQGSQSDSFSIQQKKATLNLRGLRRVSNIKEFIGVCRMPIPNNLSFSNGVSWGDGRINAVEAAAFLTANSTISEAINGDIAGAMKNGMNNTGQLLKDIRSGELSRSEPAGVLLSAFASQFALGRIGINVDANQFIQRGVGQAINPNLELLFNGPKLRSFSFSFNFAPNDELDASVMRKIQRFFKQGMAPKRSNENLIFLGSPNIFRLRYRTKQRDRIKGLPMHKICALTTCEINYAPDNVYQSYDDSKAGSSPIRTVMNLNFTELTPVFANDYLSEFEQSSNPGDPNFSQFSDEFGEDMGEGAFRPITTEDTGF